MELDIQEKIKSLPSICGVYLFKDKRGDILYIGKAVNLQKRVKDHFLKRDKKFFLDKLGEIEYVECSHEAQALLLEAALIKEYRPKYNVALRDDKSYPFVEITREDFPRIFISRKRQKNNSFFFGPYASAKSLRYALQLIRKVFGYRSCRSLPKKPCLYFHLRLCPAPCGGKITPAEYKNYVSAIIKILKGERKELQEELQVKMEGLAKEKRFEEAKEIRDRLFALKELYQTRSHAHELISLKEILQLKHIPLVIEAIDISSLQGKEISGSVVVFRAGIADKKSYRRYRIKEVKGIDDLASIAEVVRRRYRRLLEEKKRLPDLVIIDGGRAHVEGAFKELEALGLKIPLVGMAKPKEEIWLPPKDFPLNISQGHPALHLLQRIRDEAHRFARKYHLLLRTKYTFNKENKK